MGGMRERGARIRAAEEIEQHRAHDALQRRDRRRSRCRSPSACATRPRCARRAHRSRALRAAAAAREPPRGGCAVARRGDDAHELGERVRLARGGIEGDLDHRGVARSRASRACAPRRSRAHVIARPPRRAVVRAPIGRRGHGEVARRRLRRAARLRSDDHVPRIPELGRPPARARVRCSVSSGRRSGGGQSGEREPHAHAPWRRAARARAASPPGAGRRARGTSRRAPTCACDPLDPLVARCAPCRCACRSSASYERSSCRSAAARRASARRRTRRWRSTRAQRRCAGTSPAPCSYSPAIERGRRANAQRRDHDADVAVADERRRRARGIVWW